MGTLTKKALAQALRERLKKTALDNIRIRDITDDIGMNRQTFYYHFQDIYELLEWMFEEEEKKILLEELDGNDFRALSIRIIEQVKEEEVILRNIYSSINRRLLDNYLRSRIEPVAIAIINKQAEGINISEENKEFIARFFIMAILGMVFEWFESGMEYNLAGSMDKLHLILNGDLRETLKRFEEPCEEDREPVKGHL